MDDPKPPSFWEDAIGTFFLTLFGFILVLFLLGRVIAMFGGDR
jgi:hypothetical protein